MVVYLHYAHAIGMEQLVTLMGELFGLSISEGAICNRLARAREPLLDAAAAIEKVVLTSPVVCSDEASVGVTGKNYGERPFIGTLAALHIIRPSRGRQWSSICSVRSAPTCGCGTCWAARRGMAPNGRCAWHIS